MEWLFWLAGFFVLGFAAWAGLSFAPWVPAWKKDVPTVIAALLRASGRAPEGLRFFELGSGDGRVTVAAAREGMRATGVELHPLFWLMGFFRARVARVDARMLWGDLFRTDIREADIVYFFGVPSTIEKKLLAKLRAELPVGAVVGSMAFPLSASVPPLEKIILPSKIPLYIYAKGDLGL